MPSIYPPHHIQVSKANAQMLPAEKQSAQLQGQMFCTTGTGHSAVHVLCVVLLGLSNLHHFMEEQYKTVLQKG